MNSFVSTTIYLKPRQVHLILQYHYQNLYYFIFIKNQYINMNNSNISQQNQILQQPISQQQRKKQQKEIKNARHRNYVLNEWIDTQRNYIKDLNIILTKIKAPISNAKLLNDDDIRTVFSNIDVIISLSTKLLQDLESFKDNWDPQTTLIAPTLLKFYNFIKIYKEYCNKFCKGQAIMNTIRTKPLYKEIEKSLPLDIGSYLIKPVQRPPKYMLLLRDYQNHMTNQHPDYENLTIAIKKYHEVNQINNQAMQREGRRERMFQISKINPDLLTSTRELVEQYEGLQYQKRIKIYIFNDLVMLTNYTQDLETLNRAIIFDSFSFCRQIPHGKYHLYKLFICGKYQSTHIHFLTQKKLEDVYKTICGVLQNLYIKDQQRKSVMSNLYSRPRIPVKVIVTLATKKQNIIYQNRIKATVHNVEIRPLSALNQQIIFILKIQFPAPWNLCQYIQVTFNVIEQLEGELKKKFPGLMLPNLKPPNDIGFYEQKKNGTKIIQLRCLVIQEFINFLFRNPRVLNTIPNFAMQQLKIQSNLWWISIQNDIQKCKCQICDNAKKISFKEFKKQREFYITKQPQKNDQYCIFNYMNQVNTILEFDLKAFDTYQKIITFLDLKQKRIQYHRLPNRYRQLSEDYQIRVYLLNVDDHQYIDIKIHKENTVSEVMDKISNELQIYNMTEFGLFINYCNTPRMMDGDEIIYNVINQLDYEIKELQKKKGLFQKFWKKQSNNNQKCKIFMKKYFFLNPDLQYKNNMSDMKKFKFIIDQAFYQIREENILLNDQEIIQISALYLCLNQADRLDFITKAHFPVEKIKRILPKSKTSLCDNKKWIQQIFKTIQKNKVEILSSSNRFMSIFEIIFFVVRDKVKWYSNTFQLSNFDPQTLQNQKELLIGVNYKNFIMMRKHDNKILKSIRINKLEYYITAKSLFIITEDVKYRFDGKMLYNISKLIQQYKSFNKYFPQHAQK